MFEPYSTPQLTSRDVFVGGRGDVVVMSSRISRDGGTSWAPLDQRLGELTRVAITGSTVVLYAPQLGVARWDIGTEAITSVPSAPSYASDRTWRVDPANGRLLMFDPVENAVAIEGAATWTTGTLPQPTATEVSPYIKDLESNGTTVLAVSAWGVHRSLDGGASWELVTASLPDAGRDLLVLADHRFLLLGGTTSYVFDATGAATGTLPGMPAELGEASVCDDGAIVVHDKISHDLGATWQPVIASGDLTMIVERIGCGGGRYWMLARSEAWGYRLLRFTPGSPALAVGNWEGAASSWNPSGPPITRTSDGTFLVAGLAWRDGDEAWRLREIPPRTWAIGTKVYGVAKSQFYASQDGGATWSKRPASGLSVDEADAFARASDGSLLVSTFTGNNAGDIDAWHAVIWRSTDDGASWTPAYDARATRAPGSDIQGEAHRFVGVTADGAWVATDAISRDQGATWETTDVKIDRGLAFLTPAGRLITAQDVWSVYDGAGDGELRATFKLEIDGAKVDGSSLRSVAFDDAGYAYIAGGAPYVQVWRSTKPLD
ncbi:hypothetical protein BH11MYX3_BH11MYX3_10180 [soil metagenome]